MKKGFTLIELLVVIAIIALLSSIVLASLDSARSKGSNAAVKEDLNNVRGQAELVRSTAASNDYSTVCINTQVSAMVTAAGTAGNGGITCNASNTAWAAEVALKVAEGGNTYWCVDSFGKSTGESAALGVLYACQ